ncbi:cutinase-domain-containing protein [Aspergillus karnatakaensis]|uniref:putative acetyl xylan esterase (Axe1) n=1 Tax=Aspergillus karnatakaensis TaxID=1810916 RepID=UPI003CCD3E27
MHLLAITFSLGLALAGAVHLEERQSCPRIHVFGARETTVSPGYGSSSTVVNSILNAYPGATSEAINYPACGGQASCGYISYSASVAAGIDAVASTINSFNSRCPSTQIVLVGYSQGGEILDAALCGGGVPNQGITNTAVRLSASSVNMVKAAIFMGEPLFRAGLPYSVGSCAAGGFDARPAGFYCPSAAKVQSYCDAPDPYCCNGNNAATHNGYGGVYGGAALQFPPESVCNELVDLYFDFIEEKQLILFHRNSFTAAQRAGQVADFLVLGMIAMVARFSSNSYFDSVHPWQRAQHWLKTAVQAFNARSELINLSSLQGSILLSFVAFTEGDPSQEALLASQAICMIQMLRLPMNLSSDPIQREVEIRVFWEMWMVENWYAARLLLPKQLHASPAYKRPLEETVYTNMRMTDPPEQYLEAKIEALGLRDCGLWSSMLTLSEVHDLVMRLNDEIVQNLASDAEIRPRVRAVSEQLDDWFKTLPDHLQHTPANRERFFNLGLGREFTVQQLNYHHQAQMLYYQFLNKKPGLPGGGTDHEIAMYAARCKSHATALSEVMWDTNSRPGMECIWSPVNGHLLVVASSVLLYTLMFDMDNDSITRAKKLLEQNFIMLLQFRKYWSLVELSMARLRAFHRACQMNSTQDNFDMDRWMIYFLNRYDAHVSERYSDGVYDASPDPATTGPALSDDLWIDISGSISAIDTSNVANSYTN